MAVQSAHTCIISVFVALQSNIRTIYIMIITDCPNYTESYPNSANEPSIVIDTTSNTYSGYQ
jgi:hypothetical protein